MILTQHLHFFLRLTGAAFYLLTFKVLVLQMQIVQLCDFFVLVVLAMSARDRKD